MSSILRRCPFCGGEAGIATESRHGNGGCDLFTWGVACRDCGASVPSSVDEAVRDETGIRLTKDGRLTVTDSWNARPKTKPIDLVIITIDKVSKMYDCCGKTTVKAICTCGAELNSDYNKFCHNCSAEIVFSFSL